MYIEKLLEERNELNREIEKISFEKVAGIKKELLGEVKSLGDLNVLINEVAVPSADALKKLSFELKNEVSDLVMVLAGNINGTPMISVMVSENVVKSHELNAGNMVRELAKEIKGGGGGQPFYATAGGKDVNGLSEVVIKANEYISNALNAAK